MLIVDGNHFGSYPYNDLKNMFRLARPGHSLVLMDDCPAVSSSGRAPTEAWRRALREGLITSYGGCQSGDKIRGFMLGFYNKEKGVKIK